MVRNCFTRTAYLTEDEKLTKVVIEWIENVKYNNRIVTCPFFFDNL